MDLSQSFAAPLPAGQGAVFSFDFRLNSASASNELGVRAWANSASPVPGYYLYLSNSGGVGHLGADTSAGANHPLTTLSVGTWYRVQVAMPAPASGTSIAMLYLTPWTLSGPGTTTSYSIKAFGAAQSGGFYRTTFNTVTPGESENINLDNITLISGDPLLP